MYQFLAGSDNARKVLNRAGLNQHSRKASSSPDNEPPSSETAPLDLFEDCCSWLKYDCRTWSREEEELDEMQVALRAKGFDLGGVERMTDASWESFGLLSGHQARLKSGIAKWRLRRKEATRNRRSSTNSPLG